MLTSAGYPLSLAIIGDTLHPASRHSYDDFLSGNHDYYAGLVSVELVKRIGKALEAIQMPNNLLNNPEISQWSDSDKSAYIAYVDSYVGALQEAYREASRHGNALMVVIA